AHRASDLRRGGHLPGADASGVLPMDPSLLADDSLDRRVPRSARWGLDRSGGRPALAARLADLRGGARTRRRDRDEEERDGGGPRSLSLRAAFSEPAGRVL